jgi:hypothetical protein
MQVDPVDQRAADIAQVSLDDSAGAAAFSPLTRWL